MCLLVVVRVLAEVGGSNAALAEQGLKAIVNLAANNTNRRLLGEAGEAQGTHPTHPITNQHS